MANFVLVHGAWQGEWIWAGVAAGLRMRGHQVRSVDLPATGAGAGIGSLSNTVAAAATQLACAVGGPVHLVGHGMGGIVCAGAAEQVYADLASIIYLCALAPCNGDSVQRLQVAPDGAMAPPVRISSDGMTMSIPADFLVAAFMHDAPIAVAGWAAPRFTPQATAPTREAVVLTVQGHGRVPTSYIVCTEDRILPPAFQRQMAQRAGCHSIVELPLSHTPYFGSPFTVADTVHRLAGDTRLLSNL